MKLRYIITGCIVSLFLAVFLPGISAAAGVINGCVGNQGKLRIVNPPDICQQSETPISWNVTGPEGPAGPQGPQGPAGVANGIRAAVWGEFIMDMQNLTGLNCTVPFFTGAENVVGDSTGNDGVCRLTFTLPAGQPQTWGTAYTCFSSIVSGNGTSYDTTCQYTGSMDLTTLKPTPIVACRNASGSVPPTFFAYIDFVCIAP
jgi:hypothetical protein